MLGTAEAVVVVPGRSRGPSPLIHVPQPVGEAAAHGIRMRLLQILLLAIPVLPLAQLIPVWYQFPTNPQALYVASLHGGLVLCWVVLAVSVVGLLRRRPRAAERRLRRVLAVLTGVLALTAGIAVGARLSSYLRHPVWEAGAAVMLPGLGLCALVLLGWPNSGLAWSRGRAPRQLRPGRLVPGILLVLSGLALAHVNDSLVWTVGPGRVVFDLPAQTSLYWALPLLAGLISAAGWTWLCLAYQGDRARAIVLAYAAGAMAWVAALTNGLTQDGLRFAWYGALPILLAVASVGLALRQRWGARSR